MAARFGSVHLVQYEEALDGDGLPCWQCGLLVRGLFARGISIASGLGLGLGLYRSSTTLSLEVGARHSDGDYFTYVHMHDVYELVQLVRT